MTDLRFIRLGSVALGNPTSIRGVSELGREESVQSGESIFWAIRDEAGVSPIGGAIRDRSEMSQFGGRGGGLSNPGSQSSGGVHLGQP